MLKVVEETNLDLAVKINTENIEIKNQAKQDEKAVDKQNKITPLNQNQGMNPPSQKSDILISFSLPGEKPDIPISPSEKPIIPVSPTQKPKKITKKEEPIQKPEINKQNVNIQKPILKPQIQKKRSKKQDKS